MSLETAKLTNEEAIYDIPGEESKEICVEHSSKENWSRGKEINFFTYVFLVVPSFTVRRACVSYKYFIISRSAKKYLINLYVTTIV